MFLYLLAAAVFFVGSVVFSIGEGALLDYSPARLFDRARDERHRETLKRFLSHYDRIVAGTLAADTLSNVSLVIAIALFFGDLIGPLLGGLATFAVAIILVIFLGEAVPRAFGARHAESVLFRLLPVLHATSRALWPVVWLSEGLIRLVNDFSGSADKAEVEDIVDEIRSAALEGEIGGVLRRDQKSMIESIVDFRTREVREIMTPRAHMAAIPTKATVQEAVQLAVDRGHSRLPVYEADLDHILGVMYVRDLLSYLAKGKSPQEGSLKELMRPAFFIPETKKVSDLLHEFREKKTHLALVLDEYGGTAGLVTIEDVLEEIVGEINDEYRRDGAARINWISETVAEIDATFRVDHLRETLGLTFPEGKEYETVAGFLFSRFGRVPKAGERVTHDGVELTVLKADERHIQKVRLRVMGPLPSAPKGGGRA